MIRIAIVDDDAEFAEAVKEKTVNEKWDEIVEVDLYEEPAELLRCLKEGVRYDLCLSDIIMPGINGIELARQIRLLDSRMLLVFLSSYPEYAIQGYQVVAFDYILKEEMEDRWEALWSRLGKELKRRSREVYLIDTPKRFEKILLDDIFYIYKDGKNIVFVLEDRKISLRKSLCQVQEELAGEKQFILVERGFIANMEKMRCVAQKEIEMDNGDRIPVGRLRMQEVREKIHQYWGNKYEV